MRIPEGDASNLGKWTYMNEGKLIGIESHYCHMFMETLIRMLLAIYEKGYGKQSQS